MAITKKYLMGGDRMARIGGVRTMQDEIDMGLRNKDGSLKSEDQKIEETQAQEIVQESPVEEQAEVQEQPTEQPSEPDGGSQSEVDADPVQ